MGFPRNTPPLNVTGKFVVREPFAVDPDVNYTVEALEGFGKLAMAGVNVHDVYYVPYDLTAAVFIGDRDAGVDIVTLMADGHPTISLPSSFIISYPNDQPGAASIMILSINMGMLPNDVSLPELKAKLLSIAETQAAGPVEIKEHRAPLSSQPSLSQIALLEKNRIEQAGNIIGPYAGQLNAELQAATIKSANSALEEILISSANNIA